MKKKTRYGKTRLANEGFSLVELVIVMLIMVIVIGVAASLLYGMISMYEVASDQTSARRKAQDVFNVLKTALQNAGIGVPAGDFGYYFGTDGSGGNPTRSFLADWNSPVEASANPLNVGGKFYGDVLKVVYSLPTGLKYEGTSEIDVFSDLYSQSTTTNNATLKFVGSSLDLVAAAKDNSPGGILPGAIGSGNTRSFITFPGMGMHPLLATDVTLGTQDLTLTLRGITPIYKDSADLLDGLQRNVINRYADLYALKAAVAFVDDNSTFYMLDAFGNDPLKSGMPTDMEPLSGFRVEGIKAVRFLPGKDKRQITVWVLAEGDLNDSQRNDNTVARRAIKDRQFKYYKPDGSVETLQIWKDVTFEDDVYYEDFFMTWRMRNLQIEN